MYKPAGLHVVHQNIVGEVIIVDLRAGTYFSLTETASFIWEALINEFTRDEIVDEVCNVFDGSREAVASSVDQLLQQLVADQLIVKAEQPDQNRRAAINMAPSAEKRPFVKPTVQKYSDMEDILVLDPIHDFDDAGWPNVSNTKAESHTP
jgi:hypothetical protein